MESQTSVSKRAPREIRNWRVQGNPLTLRQPFANPLPTLRQPLANLSPTFFANLFCQPLSNPLFPSTSGTRLETLVNGFLDVRARMNLLFSSNSKTTRAAKMVAANLAAAELNYPQMHKSGGYGATMCFVLRTSSYRTLAKGTV